MANEFRCLLCKQFIKIRSHASPHVCRKCRQSIPTNKIISDFWIDKKGIPNKKFNSTEKKKIERVVAIQHE